MKPTTRRSTTRPSQTSRALSSTTKATNSTIPNGHHHSKLDGGSDQCARCHGFVVAEMADDYQGTYRPIPIWRCINCGDIKGR